MKICGITSDVTTCECCGKTNLKKTIALSDDLGGIVYYGSDCAGKAFLGRKSAKNTSIMTTQAMAVNLAKKLIPQYGLSVAAQKVWDRFGFMTTVRNNSLIIADFAVIEA